MARSKTKRDKMKRKPLAQTPTSTATNSETTHPGSTFPFLELPPELRNAVYEKVSEDHEIYLHKRKVKGRPTLIVTNRQIREEYLALYPLGGSSLRISVNNFDFSEVVGFVKRILPSQLAALPPLTPTPRPAAMVLKSFTIVLSSDQHPRACDGMLLRWLDRLAHSDKKGTMLDITYEIERKKNHKFNFTGPYFAREWIMVLEWCIQTRGDTRSDQEAAKIKSAFLPALWFTDVGDVSDRRATTLRW